MKKPASLSRRSLLAATAATGAAVAMPRILTAKRDSKQVIVGEGEHKFEVLHD
ncbi:MAG: twin-arginine translocation signal domain-containing protein, partial [Opitutae bacterium]|nr:twin-arginine translocation signal domain-containing protein [Opitutae bacterium]